MNLHEFLVNFQAAAELHPLTIGKDLNGNKPIRTVKIIDVAPRRMCPLELAHSHRVNGEYFVEFHDVLDIGKVIGEDATLIIVDAADGLRFLYEDSGARRIWRAILLKLGNLTERTD